MWAGLSKQRWLLTGSQSRWRCQRRRPVSSWSSSMCSDVSSSTDVSRVQRVLHLSGDVPGPHAGEQAPDQVRRSAAPHLLTEVNSPNSSAGRRRSWTCAGLSRERTARLLTNWTTTFRFRKLADSDPQLLLFLLRLSKQIRSEASTWAFHHRTLTWAVPTW